MDPEKVKETAFMLASGAGALALVTALPALFGKRRRAPGAMGTSALVIAGGILLTAIAGAVGLKLEAHTGLRGCALAAGAAALLAPLATLVGCLCSDESDEAARPPSAAWSLIPGIFLFGLALFEMGWLARQYGLHAVMQARYWVLGASLGLTWSVLVLRATRTWPGAEALCGNLAGAGLIAITLNWTLQLAGYHFSAPSTAPWFVLFCGVGILAGWALSLVSAALSPGGAGSQASTVGSALVMAVAVGAVAGSAQTYLVPEEQFLLAAIAAGFVASLTLLPLTVGPQRAAALGKGADSLAATACVVALAGLAWVGFKLMLGLGMAVCAIGFLAAWPAATAMGVAAPSRLGMPVPQRFVTIAAGFLTLLTALRVFQEAADLMLSGIDISDGNVLVSLIAGLGLAVLLESLFGRPSIAGVAARGTGVREFLESLVRLFAVVTAGALAILCVTLFAGMEGAAVLVIGLALWSLVAATSIAATGEETGVATYRALPAALLAVSLLFVALPWKDVIADVTREQKWQFVSGLITVAVVGVLVSASLTRRSPPPDAAPAEGEGQAPEGGESSAAPTTPGEPT